MKRHLFIVFALVLAPMLAVGCSGDDTSENNEATTDSGNAGIADSGMMDVGSSMDAEPMSDAQVSEDGGADTGMNPSDMGTDPDMNGASDSGTEEDMSSGSDMGTDPDMGDPFAGRPLGQCTVDDDCPENPNGKTCNRRLPGGACSACGNDTVCDDTCLVGTCVTTCSSIDDCPPGLRCSGTGRCIAERCQNDVCPIPFFGCSESGFCERVDCSGGQACPAETTCVQGLCVEDRALP